MEDGTPPVNQSPLYKDGKSLGPGTLSARRGLASAVADLDRAPDQAKVLHNLQQHKKRGVWTSRGIGFTHDNSSALNAGGAILGFGRFIDSAGALKLLIQAGSVLGSYDFSTHALTNIITGLSTSAIPCMRAFSPSTSTAQAITVYCNGSIEPRKVTSVSAEAALEFNAGVWPGTFNSKTYSEPKFCENFGDRMAFAGFPDANTQFDILISNQADAEVFTQAAPILATDAVAFTAPAELGPVTGIKSFRPSNTNIEQIFVIGQRDGISVITGDNASTYRLDILTDAHGIINNRLWVQVLDDLVYLSDKGVYSFSSLSQNAVRPSDALSADVSDIIKLIDLDNCAAAFAIHHPQTQEVQFWFPLLTVDAGQNKSCLVMSYNTGAPPGVIQPAWSTKNGFAINSAIELRGTMYGGSYAGFVQKHYTGDTYNGDSILFRYVSALISISNLLQSFRFKELAIVTDGGNQKFAATVTFFNSLEDGSTRRTAAEPNSKTITGGVVGGTTFPTWTLGTSAFPSEHLKKHKFTPRGRGWAAEVELGFTSTSGDGLDYSGLIYTLSIGGFQR
ncbi:MAG: hypothetical protein K2W95_00810 [Candidatus Obscuribacterales bacterium]|nr:hypothetical protein [Candidatus Obscuribacterales bacterium]